MVERISWLVLALIHALPAFAFLRPSMIAKLYGVAAGSETFLLLHHRAALFAVVLLLCVWSAFDPATRKLASVAVAVSMISFLWLYWSGGSPPSLRSIAIADLVGLPFLAYVAWKAFSS